MKILSIRSASGQSITDYTFVIAFVCVLIAVAFGLSKGSLFGGISGAYSNVNASLSQMNTASDPGNPSL